MAEWLYERGIGEARAALVEHGTILEAAVERDGTMPVGSIVEARLTRTLLPGRRALATLADGTEALVEPPPLAVSEGAVFLAELVREPIPERGAVKRAKLRAAAADAVAMPGQDLLARIRLSGLPVAVLSGHEPDRLEQAGWSELLEDAREGRADFTGGALRISPTPAMTLIDVDGPLAPLPLALAGAAAAGRTIRRLGIGGSIGIDLPTVEGREARQSVAAALDAALPPPFERTAMNGFGFIQLVRRRARPSLQDLQRDDPVLAAALSLLRRAGRADGHGAVTLVAAPEVTTLVAGRGWDVDLSRQLGAPVALRPLAGRPIFTGDVERSPH